MANISLEASVRTCKVNTGWASRIQSDRFENSNLLMCPVWNERDLTGRKVCEDSFYTKREGCNSPLDRINVENDQRPQYAEYITLDTAGYRADMIGDQKVGIENFRRGMENYSGPQQMYQPQMMHPQQMQQQPIRENYVIGTENTMPEYESTLGYDVLNNAHKYTGQFGYVTGFRQNIEPNCSIYPYEYAMASMSQNSRYSQGAAQAGQSQEYRQSY